MEEVWKAVVGYEGLYQVSNLGRVRSCDKLFWNGKTFAKMKARVLKPFLDGGGYLCISLSNKSHKNKKYKVHRLVAFAFLPNKNNYPIINHKDENKTNNFVFINNDGSVDESKSNLEWCTYSYNIKYGTGMTRMVESIRRRNGGIWNRQQAVCQFDLNGNFIAKFASATDAAKANNITRKNVTTCCNNQVSYSKGYIWLYEKEINSLQERLKNVKTNKKKVGQFLKNGEMIDSFSSILDAHKKTGCSYSGISLCCNKKKEFHKGFIWKFI